MQQLNPPSSNNKKPALIDSLTLYSEQCSTLLRQALEREKQLVPEGTSGGSPPFVNNNSDSEDSDDNAVDVDESSSGESSSEEDGEGTVKAESDSASPNSNSLPPASNNGPNTAEAADADKTTNNRPANNSKPKPKKKTPKPTQTQQQQQLAIKKYVEQLTCDILSISDNEALHLPTSLRSKHHSKNSIADRNYQPPSPSEEFLQLSETLRNNKHVLVVLLRSGRFAAGIFSGPQCVIHRVCQRYTVRKGQGKAQSAQDASRKPKSMGAQLRRAGEEMLQQDIYETLAVQWKQYMPKVGLVLLSCPKAMTKYLFDAIAGGEDNTVLSKGDARIRRLPLDLGRPSFENVTIAHQVMMTATVREWMPVVADREVEEPTTTKAQQSQQKTEPVKEKKPDIIIPLTPLHEACQKGDIDAISQILLSQQSTSPQPSEASELNDSDMPVEKMINLRAGPDFMTALHYAAESASTTTTRESTTSETESTTTAVDPATAAACVTTLLLEAKADPSIVDARRRPPYFLASHDKIRDAFRMARASLGEDYCRWDQDAKVGPPLTEDDLAAKKQKEADKKKKKKARQKARQKEEKEQEQEEQRQKEQAEAARQQEEDAKRVRHGLQPKAKPSDGGTVCDFCQTVVKGRKRKDMFSRLEYVYCSADCVQKHKRELMAAAAMARFG